MKAAARLLLLGIALLAIAGCATPPPDNRPQSNNIWEEAKPNQDVLFWPENSDDKEARKKHW